MDTVATPDGKEYSYPVHSVDKKTVDILYFRYLCTLSSIVITLYMDSESVWIFCVYV